MGLGGVFWDNQNPKCQDLPKFEFSGEQGNSGIVKTQSAKICLNLNFRGVGGGVSGMGGCSAIVKTQSAKICLNLNFRGRGGYSGDQIPV